MKKNIIKHIKDINLLFNVCLNRDIKKKKFYNFLTIETDDDIFIYDISNGIDYSNIEDKNIAIIDKVTTLYSLYEYEEDHYQSEIEFGPMDTIKLYKNAKLKNLYSGLESNFKIDIIEFKDINDNKFFISYHINDIAMRNNCYEISDKYKYKNKGIILFKNGIHTKITQKILDNKLFELSKLFYDYK